MTAIDPIHTRRLSIHAADLALLDAELAGRDALAAALGVRVPEGWPPGEHDADAVRFFRARTLEGGEAVAGWLAWYAVLRADDATPATLVGACGYFGPPNDHGRVEIGYSVVESWRGRGLAGEMVRALVDRAFADARVSVVAAEARHDNAASIAVLRRAGFRPMGEGRDRDQRRFERTRDRA